MISESTTDSGEPAKRTDLAAIILAAGKGTRMKSRLPKVFHPICGLPMVEHVVRAAQSLDPSTTIVTIGPATEGWSPAPVGESIHYAWQPVADGTAGAAEVALEHVPESVTYVLVLNGDVPLVEPALLQDLVSQTQSSDALIGFASFEISSASRYGRVQRDGAGHVVGVVEAADDDQRADGETIEVNSGIYCFDLGWLRGAISEVSPSASGERYLTDLIAIAAQSSDLSEPVIAVRESAEGLIGVDDRARLAEAERTLRLRLLHELMLSGVTIVDPETTYIDITVTIEPDVRIEPGCHIHGQTVIREGARIGPGTVIDHSEIGPEALIKQSWIEQSTVGERVHIGPYSHLRPGTTVEAGAYIGNFVEMKNTHFGAGSHAGHFSYLGDAMVGHDANIGAGTVTCNYDGKAKHQTLIGDRVFVGSDSMLVAPVELGDDSATGAGAVVTRSVPAGKRAVGVPARVIGPTRPAESDSDDTEG